MRTKTPAQAAKILEAAAHLFSSQRFHEVRMDDIADEAKVGKGTLYRYFRDKEELYLALLQRASEQFYERVRSSVGQACDPRSQLEAVVETIVTFFDEQPHLLDLIQRAEVMRATGTDFPWKETRELLMDLVLEVFAEARAQGQFDMPEPELAAMLLLGGLRTVLRMGKQPRRSDLARRVVDVILVGAGESFVKGREGRPQRAGAPAK